MLSVERECFGCGRNLEVSSIGSGIDSGDDEYESSGKGFEMGTSEADAIMRENYSLVSERAASTTLSAGSSVHSWVMLNRRTKGLPARVLLTPRLPLTVIRMVPMSRSLPARWGSKTSYRTQHPRTAMSGYFKGRTHAEERQGETTSQTVVVAAEVELYIELHVEEEDILEQALQVGI